MRRRFEHILVSRQVELLLLVKHNLNLSAHMVVDLTHKILLMLIFLDLLFHVTQAVVYDFAVEFKFELLTLYTVLLLPNLDRKEVHHVVALLGFLE